MFFKKDRKSRIILFVGILLLLIGIISESCIPRDKINSRINSIVRDYAFSIPGWEFTSLADEIVHPGDDPSVTPEDIQTVEQYFELTAQLNAFEGERLENEVLNGSDDLSTVESTGEAELQAQKDALTPVVESIIEKQIRTVLTQDGIYNPFFAKFGFPPVNFKLRTPPNVLVISPRDRIERIRDIMLLPELTSEEISSMETQVNALSVSALVVPLGGLGATFPTFVQDNADLRFTLDAAVEEWLHQYLAFKPLGFNYVLDALGLIDNNDIITVNETVAGIVSDEIGAQIYEKYYGRDETETVPVPQGKPQFDFNAAMRQIRLTVDDLLAKGQVTQAEQYMDLQRQFLASKGYYIKKLNQAYFAFYGSYADSPTSVDPIGTTLREIRSDSLSVTDFLNKLVGVTNASQLDKILQK